MTDTQSIDRDAWATDLDRLTVDHKRELVTVELIDPEVGYEPEIARMPLAYITYDPKDDVVIVAAGGDTAEHPVVVRHLVPRPAQVDIAVEGVPHPAVRVVGADGSTTLVTFFGDGEE